MAIGNLPAIPWTKEQFARAKEALANYPWVIGFTVRYCTDEKMWFPVLVTYNPGEVGVKAKQEFRRDILKVQINEFNYRTILYYPVEEPPKTEEEGK